MTRGLLLAAALLALLPSLARADARVSTDPWGLSFTTGAGTLAEDPAHGTGPTGTLGLEAGGVWFHATTAVAQGGGRYSVATNDPAGRTLDVRVLDGAGVTAVAATVVGAPVTKTGIAFKAVAGERYLGFGERSNAVDQRGNTVEDFVSDGPYLPAERNVVAAFVPPQGYSARDDATYFPIPWLVSTRGYGVLVDNPERSLFRLTTDSPDAWSVEVEAGALSFRVFEGPKPADVVRRFSATVGRQPRAAAPFYFGPWFQPAGDDAASIAALKKADSPASVANTYTHYLPCGVQKAAAERARTKLFHDNGLAVTTYFNPMVCTGYPAAYDPAAQQGLLTRNAAGQPYLYKYTGSTQFLVGQFDFAQPAARAYFGGLLKEAVDDGYDGWMEDFGEYTPSDSQPDGVQMHNLYPTLYHRAARDYARTAPKPLARFNRSGWTGAARESQIVWGGDPTTDWGYDGLRSAVRQALTMGLSGVSIWGSDVGGYFTIGNTPQLTPELLKRWIEFGFASGVMRTEANGTAIPDHGKRPQIFDADVLPIWRRYAKLRTQLYPYIDAADAEYQRSGMPIMRHLALAFPGDARAAGIDDEFMFGRDLLVAPVLDAGAAKRSVYVPKGRWIDLWRSADFVSVPGTLRLRRSVVITGGHAVTVPAPIDQIPLLVRAGALLPLLPADTGSLVGLKKKPYRLLAFPSGRSARRVGTMKLVSTLRGKRWTLVVSGAHRDTIDVEAALPCGVYRKRLFVRSSARLRVAGCR